MTITLYLCSHVVLSCLIFILKFNKKQQKERIL